MSRQVQVDYKQIAIQCNSVCEVAKKRLQELEEMLAKISDSSSRIMTKQVQELAVAIQRERNALDKQINGVIKKADEEAKLGSVQMNSHDARYEHRNDAIIAAEDLQRTVDNISTKRLIEFQSLLYTLLGENIQEHQRRLREQTNGAVTVDSHTQLQLDKIEDEVLRQFTYLAYLNDNT
ncbi:MAG: hypothetical protein K2G31_05040, partial [Clostridia bacterium]|nr:hypothetical protein [Clostridia bacterium]